MSCCSTASKCFLNVLGLIFWGCAAALITIGIWVYESYHHYKEIAESTYTLIPATVMLGVGVFVFVVGLMACIGACKENKCILTSFLILLLFILIAEVVVAVMGYIYRIDVEHSIRDGLDKALSEYDNETLFRTELDWLQENLDCCGRDNATDWMRYPYYSKHNDTVPLSCCKHGINSTVSNAKCDAHIPMFLPPNTTWQVYDEGCLTVLKNDLRKYLAVIAAVSVSFAILQIVGLISSSILICRTKETPYLTLGHSSDGYRV